MIGDRSFVGVRGSSWEFGGASSAGTDGKFTDENFT